MKFILNIIKRLGEAHRVLNDVNMNRLRITKKGNIKKIKK